MNIQEIHHKVRDLRDHTKECVSETDDVKGKVLLETTYEVLAGLEEAFDHYSNKSEEAWR